MRLNEEVQVENMSDTGYSYMHIEEGRSENVSPMIVRLPAIVKTNANKAKGLKKTQRRAVARVHKSIKCLEKEVLKENKKPQ